MKKNIILTLLLLLILFSVGTYMVFTKAYVAVKKTYTIVVVGDSMVDTMQTSFPFLTEALERAYPGIDFKLYNYGIGAENIEAGLRRFDQLYTYKDRNFSSIAKLNPDIIIVGSWAYNPFAPHDPYKHKQILTQLVQKAKKTGAQVYLLKEIAPLGKEFGRGVRGVNWDETQAEQHAQKILSQLYNVDAVATEQQVPVINAYDPSKTPGSQYGQLMNTSESDGIHASPTGHRFMAKTISETITPQRQNAFQAFIKSDLKLWMPNSVAQPLVEEGIEVGGGKLSAKRTLFGNIIQANNLTTIASMLRFTQLDTVLESGGQFTIFVPNNRSLEKLSTVMISTFFAPENIEVSKEKLAYHIVPGKYTLADLQKGVKLKTLNGRPMSVGKKYNSVVIQDVGVIETADIISSNGIIHVIDTAFLEEQPEVEEPMATEAAQIAPQTSPSPTTIPTSAPVSPSALPTSVASASATVTPPFGP